MFGSRTPLLAKQTVSFYFRRPPHFSFSRRTVSSQHSRPSTTTSRGQNHSVPSSSSAWKAAAAGLSGILLVCSLDFVAPSLFPLDDPEKEVTYWKDRNSKISSTTPSATSTSSKSIPINHRPQLTATKAKDSANNKNNISNANAKAKVVIVGGGMAGLHTALALSERANEQVVSPDGDKNQMMDIVILEAHRIGQGASGKAKGLVVPGIQVPEEDLAEQCGSKELAAQVYDLTYQAMRRLQVDIVQKYEINCDWVDSGLIEASIWDNDGKEEDNDASNDKEETDDDVCRDLTASELRQRLGQPQSSNLYKCGEFDPGCSGMDPFAFTLGLAHVLEQQWSVRIYERTKATRVEKCTTGQESDQADTDNSNRYVVTTDTGAKIECQHVVLCTGPDLVSKELSQRIENAIIPIYTWMASTKPLGDDCPLQNTESGTNDNKLPAPMAGDDYISLNYWRRTDDGRLLFGSLADAYHIPRWLAEYRLRRALSEVYPQLANVPFDHVWNGTLAFASNAIPLIGRDEGFDYSDNSNSSSGGVWYATGFGGHGIVPTAMAGSILADAILGIDDKTWRVFQQEFPPPYAYWPVGRLGGEILLTVFNVVDWLHVKGVPIPRLPKPW